MSQVAVKQVDDQVSDITGCQAGTKLGIGLPQHLGVDSARTYANGADAMLSTFHRDRLGEADDPVLGDVVCGQPRELLGGVDTGERGNVDDPSLACRAHRSESCTAAEERAGQVDPERLCPGL